jgi:hypothetical protein
MEHDNKKQDISLLSLIQRTNQQPPHNSWFFLILAMKKSCKEQETAASVATYHKILTEPRNFPS